MAGETVVQLSAFATVQASNGPADGSFSSGSTTTILAALGATDEDAPLLDFKLDITSGTPIEGETADLFFHPSDGTDTAPPPSAYTNPPHYVGSFVLDAAADEYFLYEVTNYDNNGTYVWLNNSGATITATLYARSRTFNTA